MIIMSEFILFAKVCFLLLKTTQEYQLPSHWVVWVYRIFWAFPRHKPYRSTLQAPSGSWPPSSDNWTFVAGHILMNGTDKTEGWPPRLQEHKCSRRVIFIVLSAEIQNIEKDWQEGLEEFSAATMLSWLDWWTFRASVCHADSWVLTGTVCLLKTMAPLLSVVRFFSLWYLRSCFAVLFCFELKSRPLCRDYSESLWKATVSSMGLVWKQSLSQWLVGIKN